MYIYCFLVVYVCIYIVEQNNPCPHPVIILREVSIEDLEAMLAFMYEGQVNVSQTRLHTFMKLAEALQVRGLTDTHAARARMEKVGGETSFLSVFTIHVTVSYAEELFPFIHQSISYTLL